MRGLVSQRDQSGTGTRIEGQVWKEATAPYATNQVRTRGFAVKLTSVRFVLF